MNKTLYPVHLGLAMPLLFRKSKTVFCETFFNNTQFFSLLFLSFPFVLSGQLSVSTSRSTAIYDIGETIYFEVSSNSSGPVDYAIKYATDVPAITSGTLNVTANEPQTVSYTPTKATTVFCEVTQWGNTVLAGAACEPLSISPLVGEPADFDAFWNNQKNLLASVPMSPQLTAYSSNSYTTTYRINLGNIDGRRVYGYISVPNGNGPFPAVISLPPAGTSPNLASPQDHMAERAGVLAVSISVFNVEPDQIDPNGYNPNDPTTAEGNFYRYSILGTIQMINYLQTRSDFDGQNIGVVGVSQGGGLAMLVAGIDQRVNLLVTSNPSHCQHHGFDSNQASPYPYYLRSTDPSNGGDPDVYNATLAATKYYDAVFAASRYDGPSLNITNYQDDVNPPATVYAAINQLRGNKVIMHAPNLGHFHTDEYWSGRFDFFRKHYPATQNPPWPFPGTTTGYHADAGADQSINGGTADLSGTIEYNGAVNTSFEVEWQLLDGPGEVSFSNQTARNTSAIFSTNGSYRLAFIAYDNQTLANQDKFYTIIDEININVSDGGGNPPPTELSLSCPNNITSTADAGTNSVVVTWNDPTALTTCNSSMIDLQQISGQPSGSSFAEGTYSITYQVNDNCDNSETCSFTIMVETETIPPTSDAEYCASLGNAPWVEWIAGVNLEGINQISGKSQYSDFTNMSAVLNQGENYSISLTPGYSYTEYEEFWKVWIDFNQDGDFEDTGENVVTNNAVGQIQEIIAIPATALIGTTRMRVSMQRGSFPSSCGNFNEGEVEDYSINIVEGSGGDSTPPMVTLSTATTTVYDDFVVNVNFSEEVTGLTSSDFEINNGTVVDLSGNGTSYDLTVSPTTFGEVTIALLAQSAFDAANNGNITANDLTVNYTTLGNITLTCPSDITVTAANGATDALVFWNEPTVFSDCQLGGAVLTQTEGLANNSFFPEGTTTVSYSASDNCDNIVSCSFVITVLPASEVDYCSSIGNAPWQEYIAAVNLETINNISFKELYGDFTHLSTTLEQNETYVITLTPGYSYTEFDEYWRVWIDFNQDGDFEDTGEKVVEGHANTPLNATILIPSTANLGTTRMRVSMKRGAYAEPCESFSEGEVEDYSVDIQGGTAPSDTTPPTVELSTNSTSVSTSFAVSVAFSEPINGLTLDDFVLVNATGSNLVENGTSYTFTANPLTAGTVEISLPAGMVSDLAANVNTESNLLTVEYTPDGGEDCSDIDLMPLNWNSFNGGGTLIYNENTGTATINNLGQTLRGVELLFSDIGWLPDREYVLRIEVLNYQDFNHNLRFYVSNGENNAPVSNLSNIEGDGVVELTFNTNGRDRFRIAGQGNSDNSFASVIFGELSLRCLGNNLQTNDETTQRTTTLPTNMSITHRSLDVPEMEDLNRALKLFPNPAQNKVRLQLTSVLEESLHIGIYDSKGILVRQQMQKVSAEDGTELDLSALESGVYWIQVTKDDGQQIIEKLLIVR